MPRRTKEDSLETRRAIIGAARDVFYQHGVTRTTLEQIAAAAGVTRGAVYWHFADKAELFFAMREEVKVPLHDRSDVVLEDDSGGFDALERIERFLRTAVTRITTDDATLRTFDILSLKCEYVGEFACELEDACEGQTELRDKLAKLYRRAKRDGILREGVAPLCAASDTLVFMIGLIRIWLVDHSGTLVRRHVDRLIVDHVAGKRAASRPQSSRRDVKKVSTA